MTSTHRTKDRRGRLKEITERGKRIPARTKEPAHRRKRSLNGEKSSRPYGEMDCLGARARGECREFCVWFSGPSTRDEAARRPNRLPFLAMPTDAGRRAEAYRHSWRLPRYSGKIRPPPAPVLVQQCRLG